MDGMKPWQIGLFIVAAVVLGGSLAFNLLGSKGVEKADRIYLVDVATGEFYYAPVRARGAVLVPARHPTTRERTLYQVLERDDGNWELEPRSSGSLDSSQYEVVGAHGAVDFDPDSAVKYVPPPFD